MSVTRAVPQPDDAGSPAEFLDLLRRLQEWSGLPVSEIEERVRETGVLVPTGLVGLLSGNVVPTREVVVAFVTACGLVPEEREKWVRAHARVVSGSFPIVDSGPVPVVNAEPSADGGDRLVVGRLPAVRPASGKTDGTPQPTPPPRHRHRKTSGRAAGSKRPVSLMVAAPAFITIAVVASTLLGAFGGESQHDKSGTPSAASTPIPPPQPGWYIIMPLTGGAPDGDCLSILPDDGLKPQVARDKCAPSDRYQRIEVADTPGTAPVYQLRAWTPEGHLRCATLDTETERSALHMKQCGDDPLQLFRLDPASKAVKAGQPYRVVPEATRTAGMCVGIDLGSSGGAHAIQTACGRTGVDGYLFTPASDPGTGA
ncbi:helix-turn-helix domain-containing protein [Actinomadura macra]|uniref:helix-turn-helix domain-containing protein n=1 Tax=Actinomadura macra TaxID=46164 RepID=UPI000831909B|nr:helix-turn-helix transcriptional regulator [Actinomadura macra]